MEKEDSSFDVYVSRYIALLRSNWEVIVLFIVGLGLLGYGLFTQIGRSGPVVEVISSSDSDQESEASIYVDVSGAVENPGVYELNDGSRIGEALTLAGGLSSSADRGWVSRYVNLAAPVSDGMKIYIPDKGSSEGDSAVMGVQVLGGGEVVGSNSREGVININTASLNELDTLWGIGQSRAEDIIANRPYVNVEELITKAGIPKNVYERISGQVAVY